MLLSQKDKYNVILKCCKKFKIFDKTEKKQYSIIQIKYDYDKIINDLIILYMDLLNITFESKLNVSHYLCDNPSKILKKYFDIEYSHTIDTYTSNTNILTKIEDIFFEINPKIYPIKYIKKILQDNESKSEACQELNVYMNNYDYGYGDLVDVLSHKQIGTFNFNNENHLMMNIYCELLQKNNKRFSKLEKYINKFIIDKNIVNIIIEFFKLSCEIIEDVIKNIKIEKEETKKHKLSKLKYCDKKYNSKIPDNDFNNLFKNWEIKEGV